MIAGIDIDPSPLSAEQVVKIRKANSMSRKQFADMLGVNPTTTWSWEQQGVSGPTAALLRVLFQLRHLEQVALDALFSNTQETPRSSRSGAE